MRNRNRVRYCRDCQLPIKPKEMPRRWVSDELVLCCWDCRVKRVGHKEVECSVCSTMFQPINLRGPNPKRCPACKMRHFRLRRSHRLTIETYEDMLRTQDGKCAICLREPPTKRRLAVDHDHATGHIRGLLCFACNTLLGKADDDIERLQRAITYLS